MLSSRSARRSKRRQDASSEPVAKASPLGKNLRKVNPVTEIFHTKNILNSVNVGLVASKRLSCATTTDIPELSSSIASSRNKYIRILARPEGQAIST